jgi:hypothetical protein
LGNIAYALLRRLTQASGEWPEDFRKKTQGGPVLAAEQITKALVPGQSRGDRLRPDYPMSGGSLIAMAADEIVSRPPRSRAGGPRPCYDRMWELWMGRDFFTGTLVDDGLSPKTPIGGVAIVFAAIVAARLMSCWAASHWPARCVRAASRTASAVAN